MKPLKICVLGGAGAMGREIVRELLASSHIRVTVADTRCDFFEINPPEWVKKSRARLSWKKVNLLGEPSKLVALLCGQSAMINATTHHLNLPAMKAALRAKVHYIDLGGLFHYTRKQLRLDGAFERAGKLAVLGMGCAPGMSNLLAVHAAEGMDRVDSIEIKVGGKSLARRTLPRDVVETPYAIGTIREELTLKPFVFSEGRFSAVNPRTGREKFSFPKPVGKQTVFNTLHSEVATLPDSFRNRGVREVSFKIGFEDSLIRALLYPNRKTKFTIPKSVKDIEITCALVCGRKNGRKISVVAYAVAKSKNGISSGTLDTAIPPAIVAAMLPKLNLTGVLPPEIAVPVGPFLQQIKRRGLRIVITRLL